MYKSIIILSILISPIILKAQSKIIEQFKKNELTELSLFFTPSTLRMVNLQRNEEFDEMVKDIKKMSFLKLDKSKFDLQQFMNTVMALQQQEAMEEYIVVDGEEQKLYLLGKESPMTTVAMAYFQGDYYAVDIAGSISIANLPKLYEQLSQGDAALKNDFANIFDLVSSASSFGNNHNERDTKRRVKDEIDD